MYSVASCFFVANLAKETVIRFACIMPFTLNGSTFYHYCIVPKKQTFGRLKGAATRDVTNFFRNDNYEIYFNLW